MPSCSSIAFVIHLSRHLELWKMGNISALLDEGRYIQSHLQKTSLECDNAAIARQFNACVLQGNIKGALCCLSLVGSCVLMILCLAQEIGVLSEMFCWRNIHQASLLIQ